MHACLNVSTISWHVLWGLPRIAQSAVRKKIKKIEIWVGGNREREIKDEPNSEIWVRSEVRKDPLTALQVCTPHHVVPGKAAQNPVTVDSTNTFDENLKYGRIVKYYSTHSLHQPGNWKYLPPSTSAGSNFGGSEGVIPDLRFHGNFGMRLILTLSFSGGSSVRRCHLGLQNSQM